MFVVKWTKMFTSGNLQGLSYDSELSFATLEDASSFVTFLNGHIAMPVPTRMGSPYTCHTARIERI